MMDYGDNSQIIVGFRCRVDGTDAHLLKILWSVMEIANLKMIVWIYLITKYNIIIADIYANSYFYELNEKSDIQVLFLRTEHSNE